MEVFFNQMLKIAIEKNCILRYNNRCSINKLELLKGDNKKWQTVHMKLKECA